MKVLLLLSLFIALPALACPGMEQTEHTERKGFKVDMALDQNSSAQMHQHAGDAKPTIAPNTAPRPRPSQADKKGRMHNS
jgi:hypothetical protein